MSTVLLEAETRAVYGKGASRRLRRLESKVPAIIYGGDKKPHMVNLLQHKVAKALENDSIYSSVFDLHIDGKPERVILKSLQRHPYKSIILHMDFQRVSAKDVLVRMVPLHFVNEAKAEGVKAGGVINHAMVQVEIRCQAKDLPEFIEVDVSHMKLDDVLHLTDLKLPANVHLNTEPDSTHNHPVVSIHMSKSSASDGEEAKVEEETQQASEEQKAAPSTEEGE